MTVAELLKQHGIAYVATLKRKYTTKCPACGGGYLNVEEKRDAVVWFCHQCQESGAEFYEKESKPNGKGGKPNLGEPKAVFDYHDEAGERLFQTLKYEPLNAPKTFTMRTPSIDHFF